MALDVIPEQAVKPVVPAPVENPQAAPINVGQSPPPGESLTGKPPTENNSLKELTDRSTHPEVGVEAESTEEQLNARIETGFLAMRKALNQEAADTDKQMMRMAKKAMGEPIGDISAEPKQLRPVEDITNTVKNKLVELKRAQEKGEITSLTNDILAECHELDMRGEIDEFTKLLNGTERSYLKDITGQNAAIRLADLFNFDKNTMIPEALRLAQEAMTMHAHLYRSVGQIDFTEKHPGAPKLVEQAHLALITELETNKVTFDAMAEVLKRHPKWAAALWKGFTEFIVPLILAP